MTATKAPSQSSPTANPPPRNVFRLHGVNVLNRKNVDSISRLTALEKRRATHILDERQRRDTMNQLLAELASLVRESAAELEKQEQQQQQQEHHHLQAEQGDNASADQKKPPVKSNSITTLRNAITEIRRLRSCMGLATVTPPCPASLQQPSSRSRNTSPSSMATISGSFNSNNNTTSGSCNSTPMSSPKMSYRSISPQQQPLPYVASAPAPQPNYHHPHHYQQQQQQQQQQHYPAYPHSSAFANSTNGIQLQSPPLSPSSPSAHKHFTSSSPPMVGNAAHQIPSLPSLFAGSSSPSTSSYAHHPSPPLAPQYSSYYSTQQQQQQPKQQGYALPPLSAAVNPSSPSSSSPASSSSAPPLLLPHPFMSAPSQPASVYTGASQYAPM
ncbi:hypothetical protein DFQ27_008818 [Actinomortierella ambigua]|uniref:BHLH domain-containing protein n=1 Tax=Actinomortierella ambigua TaxID=1343610 RepID=A0A9P6UB40_9FUNG|nr:hypothetical protein DFQ27_008818 [Actinomortierella ambigua]